MNTSNRISFSFGKNWQVYLKSLNNEKIHKAKESLKEFLGDVKNKSFLDIGCGSGIFSYSMYLLGAKKIVSFDVDEFSVQCTKYLKQKANNPSNWEVLEGSILDKKFITKLGEFDIVYSWGVLHHTGRMWDAIKSAISLVKPKGLLFIAIYNKTSSSKYWLRIKQLYNLLPKVGKQIVVFFYFLLFNIIFQLSRMKNPFKIINEYKKNRGMDPLIDIKDWFGGLPYEYATFEEVINFFKNNKFNLELIKYKKYNLSNIEMNNFGNNEFVFRKNN